MCYVNTVDKNITFTESKEYMLKIINLLLLDMYLYINDIKNSFDILYRFHALNKKDPIHKIIEYQCIRDMFIKIMLENSYHNVVESIRNYYKCHSNRTHNKFDILQQQYVEKLVDQYITLNIDSL